MPASSRSSCRISPGCIGFTRRLSVVVDDFNVISLTVLPSETDPPLIIDSETVLSCAVSFKNFQTVARDCCQIVQRTCSVEPSQPRERLPSNGQKSTNSRTVIEIFRIGTSKRCDHCYQYGNTRPSTSQEISPRSSSPLKPHLARLTTGPVPLRNLRMDRCLDQCRRRQSRSSWAGTTASKSCCANTSKLCPSYYKQLYIR